MIVKKFTATTENEAIMKARENLGQNAVVLSIKNIRQRGIARLFKKDYFEVTAALEEKDFAQNVNEKKNSAISTAAREQSGSQNQNYSNQNFSEKNSKILEEKLDNLHELIKYQMGSEKKDSADKETDNIPEKKVRDEKESKEGQNTNIKFLKLIYNKLMDSEVEEKLAGKIIEDIDASLKKEANIDNIISAVYQKIILKLGEPGLIEETKNTNVIFFMGPTGVGKTTTIAKLASDFKLNRGKKVAMITADTYRIAAVEQLNTYAGILEVPVVVIYTPSELVGAITSLMEYDMIFVDTAGRSHKNMEMIGELEEMFKDLDKADLNISIDKYLVLSATTKYRDLINITNAFNNISDYKLLFTKLDETGAYGNILNIRQKTGASLSYTTYGQNVPDDIEVIDVQGLAKHLISGANN